jgi:hypothetical protein
MPALDGALIASLTAIVTALAAAGLVLSLRTATEMRRRAILRVLGARAHLAGPVDHLPGRRLDRHLGIPGRRENDYRQDAVRGGRGQLQKV